MKYIIVSTDTDGFTYSCDKNICVEFDGSKDDLCYLLLDVGSKVIKEGGYELFLKEGKNWMDDVSIKDIKEFIESGVEYNVFTLEEWFERNVLNISVDYLREINK